MNANELWVLAAPYFEELEGPTGSIVKSVVPSRFDGLEFTIAAPNATIANLANERYGDAISGCLSRAAGTDVTLKCVVDLSMFSSAQPRVEETRLSTSPTLYVAPTKPKLLGRDEKTGLNRRFSFDNFVSADCNGFARSSAEQVVRNVITEGKRRKLLFVHARPGLGKTHLLQAIGNAIVLANPKINLLYIGSEDFVNQLLPAIPAKGGMDSFRQIRRLEVLLLDDIQFITGLKGGDSSSEGEFFHTLNSLDMNDAQIVIASEQPPRDLHITNDRLRGRLQLGVLAPIRPPDLDTRLAMLKLFAEREETLLPLAVLERVAQEVEANPRVLDGAILSLCAYGSLHGPVTDPDVASTVVEDFARSDTARAITVPDIIALVAVELDVPADHVKGPKRYAEAAWARQVAQYLAKTLTDLGLAAIGKHFIGQSGDPMDHSTVLYSCGKVQKLVDAGGKDAQLVGDLIAAIRGD